MTIRYFIDRLLEDVGREFDAIEKLAECGEFETYEDLEAAQNFPLARYEIGMKAVIYELNSLIESEIYEFAYVPWKESKKNKGPKSIDELGKFELKSMTKIKMVNDINIVEAIKLIESYYSLNFDDIEYWKDVRNMRKAVNAFKHRKGYKHFREIDWATKGLHFPQKYELDMENVLITLEKSEIFLRSLDGKIRKSKELI
jgi:hypothetical protein